MDNLQSCIQVITASITRNVKTMDLSVNKPYIDKGRENGKTVALPTELKFVPYANLAVLECFNILN